ncbi:MAG: PAS domain-containing protein [Acidobacteria bacterium]|nr:PAS domain-containing protein [Acidobacteriota bacterium]MCB9398185.1 PAS domain-containing protein [Acidobacteriota bacterium]
MVTNRFQHRLWFVFLGLFLPGGLLILVSAYQLMGSLSKKAEGVVAALEEEANNRLIMERLQFAGLPLEQSLDKPIPMLAGLAALTENAWSRKSHLQGPEWALEPLRFNQRRTWAQSASDQPTVVFVQKYLYEGESVRNDVRELAEVTRVLNWVMPELVQQDDSIQLLYFVGAEGQSFFRIAPWVDIGPASDKNYPGHSEKPYWSSYFPGLLEFWIHKIERGERVEDPREWALTTGLYIDAATSVPVQTYAFPVVDWTHKKLLGAICADVNQDQLNQLIQKVPAGTQGVGFLFDDGGHVISVSKGSEEVFGSIFGTNPAELRSIRLKLSDVEGLENWSKWSDLGINTVTINDSEWKVCLFSLEPRPVWANDGITTRNLRVGYLYKDVNLEQVISASSYMVSEHRNLLVNRLMAVLGMTLLALALGLILVTRHVVPNLRDLTKTANLMMEGDYQARVSIRSQDEFGLLGNAFNELAEKLRASFEKNRQQTRKLLSEIRNRQEVQRDQMRLVKAVEHAAESIVITDVNGSILYVNPAYCEKMGQDPTEMLGQMPRLFEAVQNGEVDATIWEELARGLVWTGQIHNRTKTGQTILENCTVSAIRDERGHIVNYVLVARDVTHEVQMESRLRQAQKLESLGTLAGGIAHDFNNLLTPILGRSELMLTEDPDPEALRQAGQEIFDAAQKARDLVRQILTFSKDVETPREAVNVAEELREIAKLMNSFLPKTISINLDVQSDSWVYMSPSQLHQVLMNLCTNAFHAMELSGGTLGLVVRTVLGRDVEKSVAAGLPPEKLFVIIQISDTGIGMSQETQERIFDPFFSTKEKGKGTGLGLATVHGIVQSNHGHIWLKSMLNQGTDFFILFPACAAPVPRSPDLEDNKALPFRKTVVLVDDEEMVLDFSKMALEKMGLEVMAFKDPIKAEQFFEATDSPSFDLLITDQTMPNRTGLQLIEKLKSLYPGKPALLVSGFSTELMAISDKYPGLFVLNKPYHLKDLYRAVQYALSQTPDEPMLK